MEIRISEHSSDNVSEYFSIGAYGDDGAQQSKGVFRYRYTAFERGNIRTMTAGAIATPVHLRRGGNVREMFKFAHRMAYEDGVCTAILHPFSFAYYNKFGYEKVADHFIVSCPIRCIDFVPRRCSLVPYTDDKLGDLSLIYKKFSTGRNLLFERKNADQFTRYKDSSIYIYYNGKTPEGYIIYSTEKELCTNHFENGKMLVKEFVYTSREALCELFSFIRMYEGELEDVEFQNLAPTPEVDALLRNYTHTRYRLLPDISAKIINAEGTLSAMKYPEAEGQLTISVPDGDEGVKGTYLLEWGGGEGRAILVDDNDEADVTVTPTALARLIYGYDIINQATLPYLNGVSVHRNSDSLIAAFPKKCAGVFEHF